ncbi:MAG: glycosyltransferase 87 family protein [Candidatus Bathyarchaeia archaeon]
MKVKLQKLRKHLDNFKTIVLLGIIVRLALCFWTGHPWDFEVFIRVGYYVAKGSSLFGTFPAESYYNEGLGQPIFPQMTGLGYLPAWGLYTALVYKIYSILPQSPFLYYFMLKLAPILGDLASAHLIYSLTLTIFGDVKKARAASLAFFLCPFVILISSVWGMFDSIPLAFTLASATLLLSDKPLWSGFYLGMGIYMKVVPIIYLPIHMLYLNSKKGLKEALTHFLIVLAVPFVFTMVPLILFGWETSKAAITIFSQTQRTGEVLTYWNLSALLNELFPKNFSNEILHEVFSFPLVRYFWVLGLMTGYLMYHNLQKSSSGFHDLSLLLSGYLFTTISFLLTRTFIPEQFTLYLAPLIVVQAGNSKPKKMAGWWHVWVLTLIFVFINLYPFAFAYLISPDLWYTFSYWAFTKPYSIVRNSARFVLAVVFDLFLVKILYGTVRNHGKTT